MNSLKQRQSLFGSGARVAQPNAYENVVLTGEHADPFAYA